MKLIRHVLDTKGREVISIDPDATVLDAIKLMAEKGIGALTVMRDGRLIGMLSERDYARKVILKGRSSRKTRVSEIMTPDVITTTSSRSVHECMELVTGKRIRHLPVVEDGEVLGLVSLGDLVQAIIADQQAEIEHLEQYIKG
ncbi:MAG TPA: CBS domain-containing protein [Woeseiaceae bacterium]|jgi:CBS domain-containing protein